MEDMVVTEDEIRQIIEQDGSKSGKMVALYDKGMEVGAIAKLLDVRYNFVYNVVSKHCKKTGRSMRLTKRARSAGRSAAGPKKVLVVMGSDSDLKVMERCIDRLKDFGIPTEVRICSAHRTPVAAEQLAKGAARAGFGVIIAAAGKAAHLGGVLAAHTTLPVIGVPMGTSVMGGMDSLLSIVQMPKGIPVATVAIDGAENAAILAAQMLALSDEQLADRLQQHKAAMEREVLAKDETIRAQFA